MPGSCDFQDCKELSNALTSFPTFTFTFTNKALPHGTQQPTYSQSHITYATY